jgi:hypothetical protein
MERVLVENLVLFHKGEAKGQKWGKNYLEIHVEVEHNSPHLPLTTQEKTQL